MPRLRLIAPAQVTSKTARTLFPPLALAAVAALTPQQWDIEIIDESVTEHHPEPGIDLVGITSITGVAPRAYEHARQYRALGVPVVMGGIHPSALPKEALDHADAVVIGEAEPVWAELLEDLAAGRLRRVYQGKMDRAGFRTPVARRDLFDHRRYLTVNTVQTSRGCPFNCSFCSVTRFFGRTYRTRPLEDVVAELKPMAGQTVLFVDDNVTGNPGWARRLFQAITPLGIRWLGQSSITIAEDTELLDLAAASGCAGLFIGFESLLEENLCSAGKARINRTDRYRQAIRAIHSRGIGIEGAFIFGFDHDTPDIFARTLSFARDNRLAAAQFGILTPFPGTAVADSLRAEGRITTSDWSQYTISNVVFRPRLMTADRLREGFVGAYREFYSYRCMLSRLLPGFTKNFGLFWGVNLGFRRIVANLEARTGKPLSTPT